MRLLYGSDCPSPEESWTVTIYVLHTSDKEKGKDTLKDSRDSWEMVRKGELVIEAHRKQLLEKKKDHKDEEADKKQVYPRHPKL